MWKPISAHHSTDSKGYLTDYTENQIWHLNADQASHKASDVSHPEQIFLEDLQVTAYLKPALLACLWLKLNWSPQANSK